MKKIEKQNFPISDKPWLVPQSISYLEKIIKKDFIIFETGAGGSTLWFAKYAKHVFSFEHLPEWYQSVSSEIEKKGLKNISLVLRPEYPTIGFNLGILSIDLALVDGRGRVKTIETIWPNLKVGGYLNLDNSERKKYAPAIQFLNLNSSKKMIFKKGWETTIWIKQERGNKD